MKCKFLLVVLVIEILFCLAQDNPRLHYLKLALIWPNSFSLSSSDFPSRLAVPQNFTIKALWEEEVVLEDPTQLTYCNTNADLTDDMIFGHKNELLKFWPDLSTYNYSQSKKMWKELWKKFGSCYSDMPETYLVTTLRLGEAHNLYQILKSSGIVANGRSYPANKILKAIWRGTGCLADIVCDSDILGNVFLSEIHLCIEYEGKTFTDCQYLAQNCDNDPIFPDSYFG